MRAFAAFEEQKVREASAASIQTLTTTFDEGVITGEFRIGNTWTRSHYDGDFGLVTAADLRSSVSLVFVQSRDHNTGETDPGKFGGGPTDTHLIYEGLSRVAADGVLAGAATIHANSFFSVWHPELIALRQSLGLSRHPAQLVVSKNGRFDITSQLFNVPHVPVFLLGGERCLRRHAVSLRERPWIQTILLSDDALAPAIDRLRIEHGIRRISVIGGRHTATSLVDEGLAQDIYLTTGPRAGGEPGTPWYVGSAFLRLNVTTRKQWIERDTPVVFEHILIQ